MPTKQARVEVAKVGKVVGLQGELKLHLLSDFEEQFVKGATFHLSDRRTLTIEHYNPNRGLVKFEGYNVREDAAVLTNAKLFTSQEESRENCDLKEGEYFWFDMIGAEVVEEGVVLGIIDDIERITTMDYLLIKTDAALISQKLPKRFYIPYIKEVYIDHFDLENKKLYTKDARLLLEAS